jgi:hypothetical protein
MSMLQLVRGKNQFLKDRPPFKKKWKQHRREIPTKAGQSENGPTSGASGSMKS